MPDQPLEIGEPTELREDRLRDALDGVVDEPDDVQAVPGMGPEDLRQLGGDGTTADQHGAVPDEPSPTARGRQPAGDDAARDDEADGRSPR